MEQILQSLGMGTLLGRFQAQRMELVSVLAASDQELVRLGVTTVGERIRIRDACKKAMGENTPATSQTAVVGQERLSIFNPRRHNSRNQVRATTRSSNVNRLAKYEAPNASKFQMNI